MKRERENTLLKIAASTTACMNEADFSDLCRVASDKTDFCFVLCFLQTKFKYIKDTNECQGCDVVHKTIRETTALAAKAAIKRHCEGREKNPESESHCHESLESF